MFASATCTTYGATTEDFGTSRGRPQARRHQPQAAHFYERPITLEDHQASRWIVEPLRLLDCCQETDGGQALVVTSPSARATCPTPPAVIAAAAQGRAPIST
jgi:acetyl-CoA acetyltransferase